MNAEEIALPEDLKQEIYSSLDERVRANLQVIRERNEKKGIEVTLDFEEHKAFWMNNVTWPLVFEAAGFGIKDGKRRPICWHCGSGKEIDTFCLDCKLDLEKKIRKAEDDKIADALDRWVEKKCPNSEAPANWFTKMLAGLIRKGEL